MDKHLIIREKSRARECKEICPGNLSSQDCIFLSLLFTLLIYTNEEGLAKLTKIKGKKWNLFFFLIQEQVADTRLMRHHLEFALQGAALING